MSIAQPWSESQCPLATVNHQTCLTKRELQRRLRQVLSAKRGPVEIAIHDPTAQRVFLALAVYSPEELLPQGMGSLVGDMRSHCAKNSKRMDELASNLEISLAITALINKSPSPTAKLIGGIIIHAINKGYRKISFGTTHQVCPQREKTGVVWIQMKA